MLKAIPRVQVSDRNVDQLQTNILTGLNTLIANPVLDGLILSNVSLASGSNTVNHTLGRVLQGWFIVRQRASAQIYDNQDSNTTKDKTLVLVSSAPVTIDLYVF